MTKVRDVMITDFQTGTIDSAGAPVTRGLQPARTELMVVTDLSGKALALLTSGKPSLLPIVPLVEEDADLDEVVRELAPQLLEHQEMAGAVVLHDGEIRGVLPRALIAERARLLVDFQSSRSLGGDPLIHRPVYACPQKDYEKPVSYYDPSDPPRCPSHGDLLVRKA